MDTAPATPATGRGARPSLRSGAPADESWPPRAAVILPDGRGGRMAGKDRQLPKPLLRVAGLGLLERSILTLRRARAQVFLFYSGGLLLLAWLLSRVPVGSIDEAFRHAGAGVIVAFAAAPLWYAANAIGLGLLLERRVRFPHLLYNQVVGEAMNTIVPLAGLGGDLFRARHLSGLVGTAAATRAVVQDRLVHALSGPLFSGAAIAVTLLIVPLDRAVVAGLTALSALLFGAGLGLLLLVLSPYPTRWSAALVLRLTGTGQTIEPLGRGRLAAVLAAKMAARFLNLVEITIIVWVLGLEPSPALVIAIAGLLSASAVIFFMVPQGLGVNEAGITGAFSIIGLAAPFGLAFGLIRRARVVAWAAVGVALHLAVWSWKKLRGSRQSEMAAAVAEGS